VGALEGVWESCVFIRRRMVGVLCEVERAWGFVCAVEREWELCMQ
jgi:hypothetical protein